MNFHGGDIYEYTCSSMLDFSSNINPLGVPDSFKKALADRLGDFTKYPDIKYTGLRRNLAGYLGIEDIDSIIPGSGAVELIYRLAAAIPCRTIVTVSPTFSEYGRAAAQCGKKFIELPVFEDEYRNMDYERLLAAAEPDSAVIICNPNNPTGTYTDKSILRSLAGRLADKRCWLVVDEAFIEFTDGYPGNSMVSEVYEHNNLAVVRAATKFFGMPGIRLGYTVCGNSSITEAVRSRLEPWNVNTAAVIAADTVLFDMDYIGRTRDWLRRERGCMYDSLSGIAALKVYGSAANFHLAEILPEGLDAWALKSLLALRGIWIRTPEGFGNLTPKHFRLAVRDRESNAVLLGALREVLASV